MLKLARMMETKRRAPRNRTIVLGSEESEELRRNMGTAVSFSDGRATRDCVICADAFEALKGLPEASFDLLFADPPYNLTKAFGERSFRRISIEEYEEWLESWVSLCVPLLKATASVYICGDW